MTNDFEHLQKDPDFLEFLNREFNETAVNATIQELAEFAFGSIEEAVRDYQEQMKGGEHEY